MQHEPRSFDREQRNELDWMRHADGYLAAVHRAVAEDPADAEMHELLRAMTAAIASRRTPVAPARV